VDIERHRVKRGHILRILLEVYSSYESLQVISGVLEKMGLPTTMETIRQYVAYLEEKGYVETKLLKGRVAGVKICVAKLTARGIDLLDENNDLRDEGVAV